VGAPITYTEIKRANKKKKRVKIGINKKTLQQNQI